MSDPGKQVGDRPGKDADDAKQPLAKRDERAVENAGQQQDHQNEHPVALIAHQPAIGPLGQHNRQDLGAVERRHRDQIEHRKAGVQNGYRKTAG